LIPGEALKLPLTIAGPAHQHDATGTINIPLQQGRIEPPLGEQVHKRCTNGIRANSSGKHHRRAQARQSAGHIRWSATKPIIHRLINGRVSPRGTQAINQGLSEANHRRS
jgi:hypothetical protein